MKILIIPKVFTIDFSFHRKTLIEVIEKESINLIILLGDLFSPEEILPVKKDNKLKKSKNKNLEIDSYNSANNILSLNWIGIPVLAIPSVADLAQKKLIKQLKGQDTIFIRYLLNTSTLVEDWLFIGITYAQSHDGKEESNLDKMIKNYIAIGDEHSIFVNAGTSFENNITKSLNLISKQKIAKSNYDSFIVEIEEQTIIVDLDTKSYSSLSFPE